MINQFKLRCQLQIPVSVKNLIKTYKAKDKDSKNFNKIFYLKKHKFKINKIKQIISNKKYNFLKINYVNNNKINSNYNHSFNNIKINCNNLINLNNKQNNRVHHKYLKISRLQQKDNNHQKQKRNTINS